MIHDLGVHQRVFGDVWHIVVWSFFGHFILGKIQVGRQHIISIFMILLSTIGFFMYALDSSVSRKYIRHCIVGQIKYGRYMCKVKQ